MFVHETAEIESDVAIGRGTRVWRNAHVRQGALIGRDCTIGANVLIDAGVTLGHGVKVQNNVSVYAGVTIDDEVLVGPSVVFTNDLYPRATGDWEIVSTRVCKGASIGGNATVVCGVEVGEGAMVGAGAVVTHDVAAHELVLGNPARRAGWVCVCGAVIVRTDGPRPSPWRCDRCGRSG